MKAYSSDTCCDYAAAHGIAMRCPEFATHRCSTCSRQFCLGHALLHNDQLQHGCCVQEAEHDGHSGPLLPQGQGGNG